MDTACRNDVFPIAPKKETPCGVSFFGAGNGNRTRLRGLGSRYSTDELCLHLFLNAYTFYREMSRQSRPFAVKYADTA